ncbi:hypothetical protein F4801DRAFT_585163 [Xylaria longipes]|nr:hypothetical protein F4801DRAFT_585163 [Xylaria longipes]
MASNSRLFQSLPDSVSLRTAYGGDHETLRMKAIRPYKEKFRRVYMSNEGYRTLMGNTRVYFRNLDVPDEVKDSLAKLTLAVFRVRRPPSTLVELLTIDLYNLRLSRIGYAMYANFEGVTLRGFSITLEELREYMAILARPELAMRNFSVPLGLLCSSTDEKIMEEFSKFTHNDDKRPIRLHLTIHIRSVDPALLKEYQTLYPDSVVTSICSMTVGHIS